MEGFVPDNIRIRFLTREFPGIFIQKISGIFRIWHSLKLATFAAIRF